MFLFLGHASFSPLYQQTINAYASSVTTATAANKLRQAKVYLSFALSYHIDYLRPSVLAVAMFIQFLANSYKAPATIRNYISGARSWVNFHGGSDAAFASHEAHSVLKYNVNKSNHKPVQAFPLEVSHVTTICKFIELNSAVPLAVKPALLLGYICFLRSSNLLCNSDWGGPHSLLVSDIITYHSNLIVCIRSSKTIKNGKNVFLTVYPVADKTLCPVYAWHQYVAAVNPTTTGPAFMLDDTSPLTSRTLTKLMRLALSTAGFRETHRVTMHSFRRGAAQAALRAGASRQALKAHGTWTTDASLDTYLR